jgi:hypothetical protein
MFMKQSGNSDAKGLVAYWKFDEGVGNKAFDVTGNRFQLYFCGPEWDKADKPDVVNAAISNENGFYKIAGVNYGAGTTFNVSPSKNFYFNQSLEFNASNSDYARLTNFSLRDSATITTSVNGFDLSSKQVILSKADNAGANQFAVFLNAGNIEVLKQEIQEIPELKKRVSNLEEDVKLLNEQIQGLNQQNAEAVNSFSSNITGLTSGESEGDTTGSGTGTTATDSFNDLSTNRCDLLWKGIIPKRIFTV